MKSLTASQVRVALIRVATKVDESSKYRAVFAALAKEAAAAEDMLARAQFLEGLMNYRQGSISKRPAPHFKDARAAIEDGDYETNPISRALVIDRGLSDRQALEFVSAADQGVYESLVRGAKKGLKGQEPHGLDAWGIAAALSAGISPVTGRKLEKYRGQSVFYWMGTRAPNPPTVGGLRKALGLEGFNRGDDALTDQDVFHERLDAPIGDSTDLMIDTISDDKGSQFSLMQALMTSPSAFKVLHPHVNQKLRTDRQKRLWGLMVSNPALVRARGDDLRIDAPELGRALEQVEDGYEFIPGSSDVSLRKTFNKVIEPAMRAALSEPAIVRTLLKNRDIMDVMRSEMGRSKKIPTGLVRDVGIHGVPKTPTRGPRRWKKIDKRAATRSALIKLASNLEKGSDARKAILKLLKG